MSESLPFTGWECPYCGFLASTENAHTEHVCAGTVELPSDPVRIFLNRWHWRGDRAVVERELRQLIAESK